MNLNDDQLKMLEMAAQSMFSRVHLHEYENDKIMTARQLCDLGLFEQYSFSEMVEARIDRGRMYRITGQGMQVYIDAEDDKVSTNREKNALRDVQAILEDWPAKGHEATVNEALKRIREALK